MSQTGAVKNITMSQINAAKNITDSELIREQVQAAELAYQAFAKQKQVLEDFLIEWLKSQVSPGMVVDVSHENARAGGILPYLSGCKVLSGNARHTKKFRIESVNNVNVDMRFFNLSSWTCSATPLSEKTGDPMSGRVAKSLSYGADSNKNFVTLQFDFFKDRFDLELMNRHVVAEVGHEIVPN